MKYRAIKWNGAFAVVGSNGYIADDGIESMSKARKIAKWMNENN